MSAACPYCGREAGATGLAALGAALRADDLDAAIALGLLAFERGDGRACASCRVLLDYVIAARDARRSALAARERHRIRNARLARRVESRAAQRTAAAIAATNGDSAGPSLPSAAAAALARAKARAAGTS